jgi:hypothetical protein
MLLGLCLAGAALAEVVINEVDYDQIGTDTGEFIELYNNGPKYALLSEYEIVLANGAAAGAPYDTISLPPVVIPAGGCFVICGNGANVPNCDLDITPDENFIQNGSPDGIGLRHNGVFVDLLSYEGNTPGFTEGTGTTAADDNVTAGIGLTRSPNGHDTNDNSLDFSLAAISPGSACADPFPAVPGSGPVSRAAIAIVLLSLGAAIVWRRSAPAA